MKDGAQPLEAQYECRMEAILWWDWYERPLLNAFEKDFAQRIHPFFCL